VTEVIARALADGSFRGRSAARSADVVQLDEQSAEAVRVAAYAGLRLGELLALRWSDVDWACSVLTISRTVSADQEGPTKSGHVRLASRR
jgi:integrase